MKVAISYTRFSSPLQRTGDSTRRQQALIDAFCQKHGLTLDQSLTFVDEGKSGYLGDHIKTGAFGQLLARVQSGRIASGTHILIEQWDRAGRLSVAEMYSIVCQLINAGMVICTLADEKFHTKDSMNDFSNLIISLVSMHKAHTESLDKSRRIKAVFQHKRNQARQGKKVHYGRTPGWLIRQGEDFILHPTHTETIKRMFQMAREGHGGIKIAKELNENNIPTFRYAEQWTSVQIIETLRSKMVMGIWQPHKFIGDERVPDGEPIVDYYPAVITPDEFYEVQAGITQRKLRGGRPAIGSNNLFPYLLRCGTCFGRVIKIAKSYKPSDQLMVCNTRRYNPAKCDTPWFSYKNFERVVLSFLSEVSFDDHATRQPIETAQKAIAILQAKLDDLLKQRERLVEALQYGEIRTIVNAMEANERQEQALRKELLQAQDTYLARKNEVVSFNLRSVDLTNPEERQRLKAAIAAVVEEIVVYFDLGFCSVVFKGDIGFRDIVLDGSRSLKVVYDGQPEIEETFADGD